MTAHSENNPISFSDREERVPVSGDILLDIENDKADPVSLGRASIHVSFIEKEIIEFNLKLFYF